MSLTDARCGSEKPGATRKKLSDGQGLQLWIQPNGKKLWQLVYQFRGNQKQIAWPPPALRSVHRHGWSHRGKGRRGAPPFRELKSGAKCHFPNSRDASHSRRCRARYNGG